MSAGDAIKSGDEDGEGEPASESDADRSESWLSGGAEGCVSANSADGEQDEKESADKFGAELLPDAIHESAPSRIEGDCTRKQRSNKAERQRNADHRCMLA